MARSSSFSPRGSYQAHTATNKSQPPSSQETQPNRNRTQRNLGPRRLAPPSAHLPRTAACTAHLRRPPRRASPAAPAPPQQWHNPRRPPAPRFPLRRRHNHHHYSSTSFSVDRLAARESSWTTEAKQAGRQAGWMQGREEEAEEDE